MNRFGLYLLLIILFNGCGYKPSAQYSREYIGRTIYIDVDIFLANPINGILIKDALIKVIKHKLNIKITSKKEAESILKLSLGSLSFSPMQYDKNGYVILYQAQLKLIADMTTPTSNKIFNVDGVYEFSIKPDSILSDKVRLDAISRSAEKALKSLFSTLAVEGIL